MERQTMQMVIGTAAYCGAGQDTLADSMCKRYGFKKYSMGDMVRQIAHECGKQQDRSTLRTIREEYDRRYGRFFFPEMLIDTVKKDGFENCIITGMRTIEEYVKFSCCFPFRFIFLNADENIRLKRMLRRREEKDEKTLAALRKQMALEAEMFDYKELEKKADIYFDFSMDIGEYRAREDEITEAILKRLVGR